MSVLLGKAGTARLGKAIEVLLLYMQSLSKENIEHLKEVVLPSEGVQCLVSKDMEDLLRIAAADKREELKIFSGEVVRFGNRCKDPQ
ncbi:hypothetical protein IFM89_018005 [Coptis chinensis]|uniref:DUF3475 domain-containing protein n=1 Tax=Coptis chinensis TaxID=261450 RepID=A0A835LUQ4_9MAGN|nr:hypothetical protein IFM89_018005 [Coptis chinensis]